MSSFVIGSLYLLFNCPDGGKYQQIPPAAGEGTSVLPSSPLHPLERVRSANYLWSNSQYTAMLSLYNPILFVSVIISLLFFPEKFKLKRYTNWQAFRTGRMS